MDDGYAIPGDVWYYSCWSFVCLTWEEIKRAFFRCTFVSVVKAIITCLCLPGCVVYRALARRTKHEKFTNCGIIYFYILLCSTVVFNLWQVITKSSCLSMSYRLLQYYGIVCMWLSIFMLCYLYRIALNRGAGFDREQAYLTLYLRTGLYIFGILSMGHSVSLTVNYVACQKSCCKNFVTQFTTALLQITKAFFIVVQILFLSRFYRVELTTDIPHVQVVLAHLLGTNLSLWFWTLCLEVHDCGGELCRSLPIPLKITSRFFYPVFVEYLLLAASMFYEIWTNLKTREPSALDYSQLTYLVVDRQQYYGTVPDHMLPSARERANNIRVSNGGTSIVFGLSFGVVYLVFVVASESVGKIDPFYFSLYTWSNCAVYVVQIFLCFLLQLCLQTQRNSTRSSCDYDDALLYIGLIGVVLWNAFHFYGIISSPSMTLHVDEAIEDLLALVQYFTQTATLVTLRRYESNNDKNSKWISYFALFLLTTNFVRWFEDTFFVEGAILEKPGENHDRLKEYLEVLAYIINPLSIFFRFQSATCCYHVWTLFNGRSEQQR